MQFDELKIIILENLRSKLDPRLSYHNVHHTEYVLEAVEKLATFTEINSEGKTILLTGMLLHDYGFLENPIAAGHEDRGCKTAEELLPKFGYNESQIKQIKGIINATRLPQTPLNLLEKIACDADLFYLGSHDYGEIAEKFRKELINMGQTLSAEQWLKLQTDFLEQHKYFTDFAQKSLEPIKKENLNKLEKTQITDSKPHHKPGFSEIAQDIVFMILGVLLAGIALKGFLVPNHFFDGGVTGISLLIHEITHFNLGIIIVLMNLPLIIAAYYSVGKRFAYRTLLAVVFLGICLTFLPYFDLTHDKLLISIFGGVFLGLGVGLIMRTGAALDGIEVLALYTLKRTSFTITEIILGINILIFSIAAFKFGLETALYSILTYFTASKTIDYVVEGLQAYTGVTIISGKSEEIKFQLVNTMNKGITVYKGERGYLPGSYEVSNDCDIIFTVITRLELRKLKNLVYDIDPKAFVFANTIKEASGGVTTRRQHH